MASDMEMQLNAFTGNNAGNHTLRGKISST